MRKLIPLLILLLIIQAGSAIPESWRTCNIDEECMIGDHVYNDTWDPYTDQICTINISYPNGTIAVEDADMDNNSLGWHNYSYTPPVVGYYPVEMFCNNTVDVGREDRSFTTITPKDQEVLGEMSGIAIAILATAFLFISSRFEKSELIVFRIGFLAIGILLATNAALITAGSTVLAEPGAGLLIRVVWLMTVSLSMFLLFKAFELLRGLPKEASREY